MAESEHGQAMDPVRAVLEDVQQVRQDVVAANEDGAQRDPWCGAGYRVRSWKAKQGREVELMMFCRLELLACKNELVVN